MASIPLCLLKNQKSVVVPVTHVGPLLLYQPLSSWACPLSPLVVMFEDDTNQRKLGLTSLASLLSSAIDPVPSVTTCSFLIGKASSFSDSFS